MIMADVLSVALLVLGLWLAISAVLLLFRAALPERVERAGERASERPGRTLVIGLLVAAPALLLTAVLGSRPLGKPLAALMLAGTLVVALIGVSALATRLGQRLPSPDDADRPWLATLRGGLCLVIASSLPLLGWFLIWPAALFMGVGATVSSAFGSKSEAAASSGSEATTPAEPAQASRIEPAGASS